MRWKIEKVGESIMSEDFASHNDCVEMSGEKVSCVTRYGEADGSFELVMKIVFPMIRTHPDVTESSYRVRIGESALSVPDERITRVHLDGVLHIESETDSLKIIRTLYPSTTLPAFYEEIDVRNTGGKSVTLPLAAYKRLETVLCCEGYVYAERICASEKIELFPGESASVRFTYTARFANESLPQEDDPLKKRYDRINELRGTCILKTGDDIVDTMFAFAKIRAGESLFRTRKGLIHCPGGLNYYAAVWCNDQCEYAAPWFAYTGDKLQMEAAENSFRMYEPYINDELLPMPSSIISQGSDFWNGAHDRGDASMVLYGLSRYLLTSGKTPDEGQKRLLDYCTAYIDSKITPDGVIFSDTDELENRISSGINLNTSSLTYGGWRCYAALLERMGNSVEAKKYIEKSEELAEAMERYFGANISGYDTYAYHKGCDVIRAWNCLPAYMGIDTRSDATLDAIDTLLWEGGSCRTTEGEKTLWDRSALYFLAALFRAGKSDRAWELLHEYSENRLLGEHVPYAVEAYPEGSGRHLSAESALYCRIITDGLFGINELVQGDALVFTPRMPSALKKATLKNIYFRGNFHDIETGE